MTEMFPVRVSSGVATSMVIGTASFGARVAGLVNRPLRHQRRKV